MPSRPNMFLIEDPNCTFKEYRELIVNKSESFSLNTSRKPSIQAEIVMKLLDRGHEAREEGLYDEAFYKYMRGLYIVQKSDLLHCSDSEMYPHLTRASLRQRIREANTSTEALSTTELKCMYNDAMSVFVQEETARKQRIQGQFSEKGRELDEDEQQAERGDEDLSRQQHEARRQAVLARQFELNAPSTGTLAATTTSTTTIPAGGVLPGSNVVTDQAQLARVLGSGVKPTISSLSPTSMSPSHQPTAVVAPPPVDAHAARLLDLQRRLGMDVPSPPPPKPHWKPSTPLQQSPALTPNTRPTHPGGSSSTNSSPQQRPIGGGSNQSSPGGGLMPRSSPAMNPALVEGNGPSCFLTFPSAIKARHFSNPHVEWAYNTTLRGGGALFPHRRGLRNLGNTCYMNSVLQCVASIPQLLHYFAGDDTWFEDMPTANPALHPPLAVQSINKGTKVVETFALVMDGLKDLAMSPNNEPPAFNPGPLKYSMGEVNENFKDFQQQDANEFFLSLVNALHDGLNKRIGMSITTTPPLPSKEGSSDDDPENNTRLALHHMRQYIRRNSPKSIILKTFMFQTRSVTKCHECLRVSSTFGTEFGLEVPIQHPTTSSPSSSSTPVALEQCLQSFSELSRFRYNAKEVDTKTGKNISGYLCGKCNRRVDATRQTQMYSLPNVLVVTLKRFKSFGNFSEKISTPVSVPNSLDMAPFCCSSTSNSIACGSGAPPSSSTPVSAVSAPYVLHKATEAESKSNEGGVGEEDVPMTIEPTTGTRYRLIGIVNHRGNCNGGHYTADVCSQASVGSSSGEVWNSCSDDVVTQGVKPSRALAYMLFYALE